MEFYSEKLGKLVTIETAPEEMATNKEAIKIEDTQDSLIGWTHGGWNNDNGGGGW